MNKVSLKKNLTDAVKIICFALVFALTFAGLSNVFVPKGKNDATGMSANITDAYLGEDNNTIDVVFIGNSDVYRAINPVQIWEKEGITSCDVGMPRMTAYDAYRKLGNLFKKQQPKLVVLETDCIFTTSNTFDEQGKIINDSPVNDLSENVNSGLNNLKTQFKNLDDAILSGISYNFPLAKYKYRWKQIKLKDFVNRKGKYSYFAKGFIYDNQKKPFTHGDTYMQDGSCPKEVIDEITMKSLNNICSLCSENGAQLMLLSVPSGNSWNINKHNLIKDYADEKGIKFVDFNKDIQLVSGFDWNTDTKDEGNHLNCFGAEKVTDAVIKILKDDYRLERSSLNDEQMKKWNSDAKKYYTEIVKGKK